MKCLMRMYVSDGRAINYVMMSVVLMFGCAVLSMLRLTVSVRFRAEP